MKSRMIAALMVTTLLLSSCGTGANQGNKQKKQEKTTVEVWHYYNGKQQESFNELIEQFNQTVGKEKNILVQAIGAGTVEELEKSLIASIDGQAGAAEIPNVVAAYSDTAYLIDKKDVLVDLNAYITKAEQQEYVDGYIKEGALTTEEEFKIFPIAKATEVFVVNNTDWEKFSEATGVTLEACATIEGITQTAQQYYEWTDSLTPEEHDGRAFFGRDAIANYFFVGARQLGIDIVSQEDGSEKLQFDQAIIKKIWDNYYVPFVKGYFAKSGKFRSDDMKTGNVIAMIASTSGATFFPKEVVLSDDEKYPIELSILPSPKFGGGEDYAVQQGAGMVVIKQEEEEVKASVEFLKWFTDTETNIKFSMDSGYMPVKKEANEIEKVEKEKMDETGISDVIRVALHSIQKNQMYTVKVTENGTALRAVLEDSMSNLASEDRKKVVQQIEGGTSPEVAVEPYLTEAYFGQWYDETLGKLNKLMN